MKKMTSDYKIFKKHELNRDIIENHVIKLMTSIQMHNMLEFRPIFVNGDMEVTDGQHRLEAAKRLKLPIWYEVSESFEGLDLITLNSVQRNWALDDFLAYYVKQGNPSYILLDKLSKEYEIPIGITMKLMTNKSTRHTAKFRAGTFEVESNLEAFKENVLFAQKLIAMCQKKVIGKKAFLKQAKFFQALMYFMTNAFVDKEVFEHKLEVRIDSLRSCTNLAAYDNLFRDIYNFRNPAPVRSKRYD